MARVLRYGARVSLFAEDMKGFVVSDGFIRQRVHVECLREDEHNIHDFEVSQPELPLPAALLAPLPPPLPAFVPSPR